MAGEVEAHSRSVGQIRPIQAVAFGTLVRMRRLGEAVYELDEAHGYEARVLVRSILEIYYNYAWMRLRRPHQRANRFLAFGVLDTIRIMENWPESDWGTDHHSELAKLKRSRRRHRHLFRKKDSKGVLRWARTWADVSSLEARIAEVHRTARAGLMYAFYGAFSGTAHGSPYSFTEVLTRGSKGPRARTKAEMSTRQALSGAGMALLAAMVSVCTDLDRPESLRLRVQSEFDAYRVRAESEFDGRIV
ncbi:MAG: DUF5677 domain-containing protein [Gemmatimonadota bacterium]